MKVLTKPLDIFFDFFSVLENGMNEVDNRLDLLEAGRRGVRVLPNFGPRGPTLEQMTHPAFPLFSREVSPA